MQSTFAATIARMPPQYKRLVRKQPLAERVKNYLNPLDFLLWLSEELETSDWEQWQRDWAVVIGVALNFVMLIARANSASNTQDDDVFGDEGRGGFTSWLASFTVYLLTLGSCTNAFYTFYRQRHYRMFEAPIDAPLSTPSAHRVRVDSSPAASSPLRYLSSALGTSVESRAHPDPQKDVWEISIWDPTSLSLKMFCLFSPGHILLYWLLLPASSQDSRPSTTVVLIGTLVTMFSFQLYYLQSSFSRQSKDNSLIHKEVLNEYDIKYVHPRTQPLMSDAAVQCSSSGSRMGDEVINYPPATVIKKGFQTNPNPNYVKHFDPDGFVTKQALSRTPQQDPSPVPRSTTILPSSPIVSSQARHSMGPRIGNEGSLGVYTHDRSPLKIKPSQYRLNSRTAQSKTQPRYEDGRF